MHKVPQVRQKKMPRVTMIYNVVITNLLKQPLSHEYRIWPSELTELVVRRSGFGQFFHNPGGESPVLINDFM